MNSDNEEINIDEFKSNVLDKIENMNNALDKMADNPIQVLSDKISNIEEQLCKEKVEINSNSTIDIEAHELFKKALSLQENLYKEMVKEYPKIKNITENELKAYRGESEKYYKTFFICDEN